MSQKLKKDGGQEVSAFLDRLNHPYKQEILEVRNIILNADEQITEHIKWNAPSYCYTGEDRITFNLHGKNNFRLIFHCGPKMEEPTSVKGRLIEDNNGILKWASDERAIAEFTDMNDVQAKSSALSETVKKWLEASQRAASKRKTPLTSEQ